MPGPTEPHASTRTTQPQPVLNDFAPPLRLAPAAPRQPGLQAKISGMRATLVARTARVMRSRRIPRRGRRGPSAG
jgi:hypothetical protein